MKPNPFFIPAEASHLKIEKAKARELRQLQWWKNQRGKGICHYCKKRYLSAELTMDHKVPIVRGGKSSKKNIVACCKTCNSKKKYLLPEEWEAYQKEISKHESLNQARL